MAHESGTNALPLVKIIGRHGSSVAYTLRDFLHRSDVPFEWVELTSDEEARAHAGVDHIYDSRLPVCIFPGGTRLECPTLRQITEKLGWFRNPSRSEYDLAIYGAGPAGLSAALYGASEGLKTVVIENARRLADKREAVPGLKTILASRKRGRSGGTGAGAGVPLRCGDSVGSRRRTR